MFRFRIFVCLEINVSVCMSLRPFVLVVYFVLSVT